MLPGDVGGVDFSFCLFVCFGFFWFCLGVCFFPSWLSLCCFGGGLVGFFLCVFFGGGVGFCCLGFFFQFISKRHINDPFIPGN